MPFAETDDLLPRGQVRVDDFEDVRGGVVEGGVEAGDGVGVGGGRGWVHGEHDAHEGVAVEGVELEGYEGGDVGGEGGKEVERHFGWWLVRWRGEEEGGRDGA